MTELARSLSKRLSGRRHIARVELIGVTKSGQRLDIKVALGMPQQEAKSAVCRIMIKGLPVGRLPADMTFDVHGEDTFQALSLAMQYAGVRMKHFLRSGGKIYFSEGKGKYLFPWDAYFNFNPKSLQGA